VGSWKTQKLKVRENIVATLERKILVRGRRWSRRTVIKGKSITVD